MAKIVFYGNLTADPTVTTVGGTTMMRLPVAVRTGRKGSDGNYVTNFFDATLFGKRIETLQGRLQKGTCVFISGDFAAMPYTSKDGSQKISLSVTADTVDPIARMKGSDSNTPVRNSAPPVHTEVVEAEDEELPF